MIEKKGGGEGLGGKRKMYQNSHIKKQTGNLFHTLVIGQVFKCSYSTAREQLSNGNILEYFRIFQNTQGYYGIFKVIVIPLYSRVFQNILGCYKIF